MSERHVTDERERFSLYRLCECYVCDGSGKGGYAPTDPQYRLKCPECRGEGRIRQEVASCGSPEAVGVALVTLAREGEFEGCPFGLLDREGETGQKWLVLPWTASARNVRDAARTLARSKKGSGAKSPAAKAAGSGQGQ